MGKFFVILFLLSFVGLIIGLINPKSVIRWSSKRTRGRVFLTYGLAMIVFLILVGVTAPPVEQEKEKRVVTPQPTKQKRQKLTVVPLPTTKREKVVMPKYSVLKEDVCDIPIKTQIILNILVSGEISESGLKALLKDLYSKTQQRRGFKYHDTPTHIAIFAYTTKERAESGMGQWIAMLSKMGEGMNPQISINDRQITYLGAKPEEKFGLSETKRKQIWHQVIMAEYRATREAEQKYPYPDPLKPSYSRSIAEKQLEKQIELEYILSEKYKDELTKKYGLTREQLYEISAEALIKDWPFPKR